MHRLRGLLLGLRKPSCNPMGRPARLHLRRWRRALPDLQRCQRRECAADAGRLQDIVRQRWFAALSWSTPFDDPIPLPDGRELVTLEDAAVYIQKLPKAQHALPHWQDAGWHLIKAAEGSPGWLMFAHMFMLRALHHGRPAPEKEPRRKRVAVAKIIR